MHESRPSLGTRKSASLPYHTCLCWSFTSRIPTAKITPVTFASTSLLPPRTERTSIILASTKWARVVFANTHSLTSLSQVCKTRGYIPYISSYYYRDRPCNYISRACLLSLRNQHSHPLRFVWCSCSWPVFFKKASVSGPNLHASRVAIPVSPTPLDATYITKFVFFHLHGLWSVIGLGIGGG